MEQNPQAQKIIKDIKNVLFQDDDGIITHVDTTYSNLIESIEKLAKVSYDMGYAEAFNRPRKCLYPYIRKDINFP